MNAAEMERLMEYISNGCWIGTGVALVYTKQALKKFINDRNIHVHHQRSER